MFNVSFYLFGFSFIFFLSALPLKSAQAIAATVDDPSQVDQHRLAKPAHYDLSGWTLPLESSLSNPAAPCRNSYRSNKTCLTSNQTAYWPYCGYGSQRSRLRTFSCSLRAYDDSWPLWDSIWHESFAKSLCGNPRLLSGIIALSCGFPPSR